VAAGVWQGMICLKSGPKNARVAPLHSREPDGKHHQNHPCKGGDKIRARAMPPEVLGRRLDQEISENCRTLGHARRLPLIRGHGLLAPFPSLRPPQKATAD
jgi:hypothetical protein